ncbi:MAG: hypothetical protein WBH47_02235 [Streptosporangiaceae bacterium]
MACANALLGAWAGDHDRALTEARLAEIGRLLADEQLRHRGVLVEQVSAATVYEQVSSGYDAEAGRGHLVIGVDSAPAATWSSQIFTTNSSPAARR